MLYPDGQDDERERVLPVLCSPVSQGLLGLATGYLYVTSRAKRGGLSFAFQCEAYNVSL